MAFPYPRLWTYPFHGPEHIQTLSWPTVTGDGAQAPILNSVQLDADTYIVCARKTGSTLDLSAVTMVANVLTIAVTVTGAPASGTGGYVVKIGPNLMVLNWFDSGSTRARLVSYSGGAFTLGAPFSNSPVTSYQGVQMQSDRAVIFTSGTNMSNSRYQKWQWNGALTLISLSNNDMPAFPNRESVLYTDPLGAGSTVNGKAFLLGTLTDIDANTVNIGGWAQVWSMDTSGNVTFGTRVTWSGGTANDSFWYGKRLTPPYAGHKIADGSYWHDAGENSATASATTVRVKIFSVSGTTVTLVSSTLYSSISAYDSSAAAQAVTASAFRSTDGTRVAFLWQRNSTNDEGWCVARQLLSYDSGGGTAIDVPTGTLGADVGAMYPFVGGGIINYNGICGAFPSLRAGSQNVVLVNSKGLQEFSLQSVVYDPRMIAPVGADYRATKISGANATLGRELPSPRANLGGAPSAALIANVPPGDEIQLYRKNSTSTAVPPTSEVLVLSVDPSVVVGIVDVSPRKWSVLFCNGASFGTELVHVYTDQASSGWSIDQIRMG